MTSVMNNIFVNKFLSINKKITSELWHRSRILRSTGAMLFRDNYMWLVCERMAYLKVLK